jgi:DNA (cytosine-5)-methyltransferase 1
MKALSLFSNIGIAEAYLPQIGIEVVVANELLEDRAEFYRLLYPNTNMICGDITDPKIFDKIIKASEGVELIIATPPCQGMSVANAKRSSKNDPRNSLIKKVVDAVNVLKPQYVLIENVPGMANTFINHNNNTIKIMDFVKNNIHSDYNFDYKVLNASDYSTPHNRKRLITLLSKKKEIKWATPTTPKGSQITIRDAIGHLPSLESGQDSGILWHKAKKHNQNHILWMQNTPTGKTAFDNKIHYPQTLDKKTNTLRRIKAFRNTYSRMKWDEPAPTITMTNGVISSQNNVHPGILLSDGTYSDARVLTVKELILLIGLPDNWLDNYTSYKEKFIREVLGECFPPHFSKAILETFTKQENEE